MKKVLLSIVASTLIFNTVSAEELEVLENTEATTIVEETINNKETIEVINNEPTEEIVLTSSPEDVKTYVAQIGDTKYETFDEALNAAQNNDTITLLDDTTSKGISVDKNITINGNGKVLTFNEKGIAIFGVTLTFNNVKVKMIDITSTPYSEWNWMAICASKNGKLVLNNTTFEMNSSNGSKLNAHAIYFCSNNKLDLNNSN